MLARLIVSKMVFLEKTIQFENEISVKIKGEEHHVNLVKQIDKELGKEAENPLDGTYGRLTKIYFKSSAGIQFKVARTPEGQLHFIRTNSKIQEDTNKMLYEDILALSLFYQMENIISHFI